MSYTTVVYLFLSFPVPQDWIGILPTSPSTIFNWSYSFKTLQTKTSSCRFNKLLFIHQSACYHGVEMLSFCNEISSCVTETPIDDFTLSYQCKLRTAYRLYHSCLNVFIFLSFQCDHIVLRIVSEATSASIDATKF